ncbi:MAG: Gfo/Idh/MocA family oxidoreductase [Bacteroidota bacterium]
MTKLRVGIVGPGKVAHLHAKAVVEQCEHGQLVGVCGRSLERSEEFARQYSAKAYATLQEMLTDADIEVLLVCTPHAYHVEPVVTAAKRGVHCLIEKPMASSLSDCDEMLAAAKEGNAKLGVISQRRWYAPIQRMKAALDAGKLGEAALGHIIMLGWRDQSYYESDPWRGNWDTEGGGVLINQAPHQLDLFVWLMRSPIRSVQALTRNLNHPYIEVEDTAAAVVQFENGAIGNILLSNSQKPGIYGKVHIHGSNGASVGGQTEGGAMFIAGRSSVLEAPYNDIWSVPGEESLLDTWKAEDQALFEQHDATYYYIGLQIDDFCQSVKAGNEPLSSGEEGRKTVELITAIYSSATHDTTITFPVDGDDPATRKTRTLS